MLESTPPPPDPTALLTEETGEKKENNINITTPVSNINPPIKSAKPKKDDSSSSSSSSSKRARPKVPKGTRDSTPEQMSIREAAFSLIKSIFSQHGAVSIDTPVFELKETLVGKYGEDSKLIYDLQDQGGELCSLRYDLTVPFARYVGMNAIEKIKRYHIARVYRRDQPALVKGRYREFYQCDFDIAGVYVSMAPDAECIKVLTEILDSLPIQSSYIIKINHRKLLDAVLSVCGVPSDKTRPISSAIDKLDKEEWNVVKAEMISKGVSEETADKIGQYVLIKGEPFAILERLEKDPGLSGNSSALTAFKEMRRLFDFCTAFNSISSLSFDLSLARGLDYYTGVIYEAILVSSTSQLGSIAAGGRYDTLVGMFSPHDVPAVGVSVGIERIFNLLEESEKARTGDKIKKNQTQVLISSINSKKDELIELQSLSSRMKLSSLLWERGIATEYIYTNSPNIRKPLDEATKSQIPFLVILEEDEEKTGLIKVKDMNKKAEKSVKREELVEYIWSLVQELPKDQFGRAKPIKSLNSEQSSAISKGIIANVVSAVTEAASKLETVMLGNSK